MAETMPWERQPDETDKAFEAFCLYRDLGPERSQPKVVELYGKSKHTVEKWSIKFNWKQRTEAWDNEQDRIAREAAQREKIQEIAEMRSRHEKLSMLMLDKVEEALGQMNSADLKPADLSRMVEVASKLERLSRGDVGEVIESRDGGEAISAVQFYMPDNER